MDLILRRALALSGCFLLLVAGLAPGPFSQTEPGDLLRRGVTISCWGWGAEWDTPGMIDAMREIRSLGAGWITFHPYAWIRDDGSVRHRGSTADSTVLNPLREARRLGLKVMLKPHIGYWGSRFDWRGAIAFEKEAEWARFFTGYRNFIVTQAVMAQKGGAELFCIGTETKRTLWREKDWRELISAVREVYEGKILYAANWDAYDRVPFWDAVDFIGIQAYFPLTDAEHPSETDLGKGWNRVFEKLEAFSKKHHKPIIFTELGYNRSAAAAARPWEHHDGGPEGEEIKLRCMKAALAAIEGARFIEGVFLWKWFPTSRRLRHNYLLQYDEMAAVIREVWNSKAPRTPRLPGSDAYPQVPAAVERSSEP